MNFKEYAEIWQKHFNEFINKRNARKPNKLLMPTPTSNVLCLYKYMETSVHIYIRVLYTI